MKFEGKLGKLIRCDIKKKKKKYSCIQYVVEYTRVVFDWMKTVTNKVASMFKRHVPFKGLKAHCGRTKRKGGTVERKRETKDNRATFNDICH